MFAITKKNTFASLILILLTIMLNFQKSQTFLFDTYLGRITLLFFILIVTNFNKFLGLLSVFIIVFMFHKSVNRIYYENFTAQKPQPQIQPQPQAQIQQKKENNNSNSSVAVEGFDLIGLDDTIRKGKQSNTISCNNILTSSSENAEAFTGFDGIYTAF